MVAVVVGVLVSTTVGLYLYSRIKRRPPPSDPGHLKDSPPPPPPPYWPEVSESACPGVYNYSGVLELVCHLATEEAPCPLCAGGLTDNMVHNIELNLKHSLNLPLQSSVTIQTYLDRKEWLAPTLLSFSTR